MPLRSYHCPTCHTITTDLLPNPHPATLQCSACPGTASYMMPATATPVVQGRPGDREGIRISGATKDGYTTTHDSDNFIIREKGSAPLLIDWTCANGHKAWDTYDTRPPFTPDCVTCGLPTKEIIGVPDIDWFTKEHPDGYYDEALGTWIRSRAHHREVMRAKGAVEMDWRRPMEDQLRADAVKAAEQDQVVREMLQSCEVGPDAAGLKAARDRGEVPDWSSFAEELGVKS